MIHYLRLSQIHERLSDIEYELQCGFSAEVETNLMAEQTALKEEKSQLEKEADDYRAGYDAGWEFHMGSGYNASDESVTRSRHWLNGFNQAGEDS